MIQNYEEFIKQIDGWALSPVQRKIASIPSITNPPESISELSQEILRDVKIFLQQNAHSLLEKSDYCKFICEVVSHILASRLNSFYKVLKVLGLDDIDELDDDVIDLISQATNIDYMTFDTYAYLHVDSSYIPSQLEHLAQALLFKAIYYKDINLQISSVTTENDNHICVKIIPRGQIEDIVLIRKEEGLNIFHVPNIYQLSEDVIIFPSMKKRDIIKARLLMKKKRFSILGIDFIYDTDKLYYKAPLVVRKLNAEKDSLQYVIPFKEELASIFKVPVIPADPIYLSVSSYNVDPEIPIKEIFDQYTSNLKINESPNFYDFLKFLYEKNYVIKKLKIELLMNNQQTIPFSPDEDTSEYIKAITEGRHYAIYSV